jgi:hypothetical protein
LLHSLSCSISSISFLTKLGSSLVLSDVWWGRRCRCRYRMVVGFTEVVRSNPVHARCTRYNIMWYSLSVTCDRLVVSPVSSPNKTDRHDITEILLKVVLSIITLTAMLGTIFTSHVRFCNSLEIGHVLMNIHNGVCVLQKVLEILINYISESAYYL